MQDSALKSRNYVTYLTGSIISLHGLWIYRVALGWFAWELTKSEAWVGVVAFTQFAPAVIFGPLFGVLADRFDRRAASILINSVSVINMLLLGFLALNGSVDIYVLTLLSLMQGVLDGAHMPVRMSIVPNLVDKKKLQSAIAIASITFNVSRFVGPALAGLIIASYGVATAFIVNGVSYIPFVVAMFIVSLNPAAERSGERGDIWQELKEGFLYVIRHPAIRALLIVVALASVFGRGALEMMPAFADRVYQGGAGALAILTSAIGAGAIVAGLILSRDSSWLDIGAIRLAVIVGGLLIALLGVLDDFWPAVAIQSTVDDEVRGRVSSFWGMIAFGGTSLGSLLVGFSAQGWGLQRAVIATGTLCAIAAFATANRSERPAQE